MEAKQQLDGGEDEVRAALVEARASGADESIVLALIARLKKLLSKNQTVNAKEIKALGVEQQRLTTSSSSSVAKEEAEAKDGAFLCDKCRLSFASRNKLMKHVKVCVTLASALHECSSSSSSLASSAAGAVMMQVEDVLASSAERDVFLYCTGGRVRGRTLGSVERFSFREQCWQDMPYLLENRGSHGCASMQGKIFVLGGGGFKSNLSSCEYLDVVSSPSSSSSSSSESSSGGGGGGSSWGLIAPMNTKRHAVVVLAMEAKQSIFVVGGWIGGSVSSVDCERYDVSSNTWHACAPMGIGRRLLGGAALGTSLYIFGGSVCDDEGWQTGAVEVYDADADTWSRRRDLPHPGPTSAVAVGNFIFVFLHGREVHRYDPSTDTYLCLSPLPLPEWFCFDVTKFGTLIFLSGGASEHKASNALFSYDTTKDTWHEMPKMKRQRRRCGAALVVFPPL